MTGLFRTGFVCFLLILASFFPKKAEGQVPWDNLTTADSLFKIKDFSRALDLYKPVLAVYEEKRTLLKGARCAVQAGDQKLALKYIQRAADLGWNSARGLTSDKELAPLQGQPKFEKLVKKVEAFEARSLQVKTEAVLAELDSLYAYDQKYRRRKGMETEQARLDSLNGIRLQRVLDEYGWLGSNLLSGRNYCWMVLQRQPLKFQEKYIGLMRKAVKKGEEERAFLAYLEDQMLLAKGKSQKYGTQIDAENKKEYPLQHPEKVDIYRASMGLGSYKGYLKIWKIE